MSRFLLTLTGFGYAAAAGAAILAMPVAAAVPTVLCLGALFVAVQRERDAEVSRDAAAGLHHDWRGRL